MCNSYRETVVSTRLNTCFRDKQTQKINLGIKLRPFKKFPRTLHKIPNFSDQSGTSEEQLRIQEGLASFIGTYQANVSSLYFTVK